MATSWVDDELRRITGEVLADAGSILVVETRALVVLPARCRTVQK